MRFSGVFQSASFTVRKRSVNAFLPPPYTVAKLSKNAPKTAKKIRNACGKNPHPLPPSCGSQSPKNRFVRPFFGILQVLAPKTPARWPFSHSLCVFTADMQFLFGHLRVNGFWEITPQKTADRHQPFMGKY